MTNTLKRGPSARIKLLTRAARRRLGDPALEVGINRLLRLAGRGPRYCIDQRPSDPRMAFLCIAGKALAKRSV